MNYLKSMPFIFIILFSFQCYGQGQNTQYYGRNYFLLEGTKFKDSEKEIPYQRIPKDYKNKVRDAVWDISECPSGMSIRFITNSKNIRVKWEVTGSRYIGNPNMAPTGMKGIDLYYKDGNNWRYITSGNLMEKNWGDKVLIKNMDGEEREYRIYLPLYYRLLDIEIGIDSLSEIRKAEQNKAKPIVFYGTSITQGGGASRTGMAHTNIISRKTGVECINFGFRGNGIMETEIAEMISEIDAEFFIIECLPNMSKEMVIERTRSLIETIRKKHESTPIVLVESPMDEKSCVNKGIEKRINEKNTALKKEYNSMQKDNFKNIYYIEGDNALGDDHEATVDGVHFTDLGFLRYSNFLILNLKELKLLN